MSKIDGHGIQAKGGQNKTELNTELPKNNLVPCII